MWNRCKPPTTALQSDLAVVGREVEHLERLIGDLFTLARAEVAQLEMTLDAVNVIPLLTTAVETHKPLIWQKNRVEVVADLPDSLPHMSAWMPAVWSRSSII